MSEAKFTMGSWRVVDEKVVISEQGRIAIAYSGHEIPYVKDIKANAYLIAAAPDIYHSLKEIVDDARDYESRGGKLPSWVKSAEDALAKARGE